MRWVKARVLPASTSHHQQGAFMVINCPSLGVVEAGQKAHGLIVRKFSGLGDSQQWSNNVNGLRFD